MCCVQFAVSTNPLLPPNTILHLRLWLFAIRHQHFSSANFAIYYYYFRFSVHANTRCVRAESEFCAKRNSHLCERHSFTHKILCEADARIRTHTHTHTMHREKHSNVSAVGSPSPERSASTPRCKATANRPNSSILKFYGCQVSRLKQH